MGKRIFRVRPRPDILSGTDTAQVWNVTEALLRECADRAHTAQIQGEKEPRSFLVTVEVMEDRIL